MININPNTDLIDRKNTIALLGCLAQSPELLEDINRPLDESDFKFEPFYLVTYRAIVNLHAQGATIIDSVAITSYLDKYPEQKTIFEHNNGLDFLEEIKNAATTANYDFCYHKIRKLSLLRYYVEKGYDVTGIYNPKLIETKAIEQESKKLDDMTEQDIVDTISSIMVNTPTMLFCNNTLSIDAQAGDGLSQLVKELEEEPDIGLELNSTVLSKATRGARIGCLYMRSSTSGGGKTRLAVADACGISVPYIYNLKKNDWDYTGVSEPTLFITTEMAVDEIQTLILAYVSGVNEEHILCGNYSGEERKRIQQAIQYITSSPLYIVNIPDFSIEDLKDIIKRYNRENKVKYIFFDYIHTSLRLMSEVGSKSKMSGLKEYQLLLVFATELKNLSQQLGVFIFTGSQLNGEAKNALVKDQNLLAGSKSLANKLDVGCIIMEPNADEIKRITPVVRKMINCPMPNRANWIYKIRRGRLCKIIIWSYIDLGTMRTIDLFVTDNDFKLIEININETKHIDKAIEEHSVDINTIPNVEQKFDENGEVIIDPSATEPTITESKDKPPKLVY